MLIDTQEMFSSGQAITSDAISANVIDLLPSGGSINAGDTGGPVANTTVNLGGGKPLYLYIHVDTDLTDADGTPTLTVTLESDVAAALNSAAVVHWTAATIAKATLIGGYWIAKGVPLPPGSYKRYLGIRYTTNDADFDGGTVSAWLSDTPYSDEQYRSGITTGIN